MPIITKSYQERTKRVTAIVSSLGDDRKGTSKRRTANPELNPEKKKRIGKAGVLQKGIALFSERRTPG